LKTSVTSPLTHFGATRKGWKRSVDIRSSLSTKYDIIQLIQTRRLMYFGRMCCVNQERYPYILLYRHCYGNQLIYLFITHMLFSNAVTLLCLLFI